MENFLNDLREYAKGDELYDIQLIFNESLIEAFTVAVPANKGDEKKLKDSKSGKIPKMKVGIYIRCHTDAKFGHSTSVKITFSNKENDNVKLKEYTLPVPTKAYNTLRNNAPAIVKMEEFMDKARLSNKIKQYIRSYIYDNQMAIIAYWYSTDLNNRNIEVALEKYLHRAFKRRSIPKSVTELEADKEMLINYVRKECKDDTIVLYFGA